MVRRVVGSIPCGGPIELLFVSSQCPTTGVIKGSGMCYSVCGMMHIKELFLLFGKKSPCGGSVFPLLLSEWSFTICVTPYNCNKQGGASFFLLLFLYLLCALWVF